MIRRALLAILGIALFIAGSGCFSYPFTAEEPSFLGPPSTDKAMAYIVLGIALGAMGMWLIRLSLKRGEPH